jgi:arginine repressor
MAPRQVSKISSQKFDPSEQFRTEIEERTANGETCEQIASALRAKGIDITNKTISRRRVEWGLRRRPPHKYAGMKHPKPRPKKGSTASALKSERKAEIEARTQRGETAEQIADALIAQGFQLSKGASTVMRLQTFWGLIPYDKDRARGRVAKKAKEAKEKEKVSQREREKEANRVQREGNMHYPADCSFGPKKRANGIDVDDELEPDTDFTERLPPPPWPEDPMLQTTDVDRPTQDGVSVAAEIMSVDFLVDLANSTLAAATNLKSMLLAFQSGIPVPNSGSMSPPSLEDLSTARRKVREAAAVMHDLAAEPSAST